MVKSVIMYLCMIITLLGCGRTPSPEMAYTQFIEYVNSKDWGRFYDSLDAYSKGQLDMATWMLAFFIFDDKTRKEQLSRPERDLFIKVVEIEEATLLDFDTSQSHKVIKTEREDKTAILTVSVGGKEAIQRVVMVLEDKEWKLHSVVDRFSPADKISQRVAGKMLEKASEEMLVTVATEATERIMGELRKDAKKAKGEKLAQEVKEREKEERLRQILSVTLLEKSFLGDYISIKIGLENKSDKDIKTVKGILFLENNLGKIYWTLFEYDKGIKANSMEHWTGEINVNYCRTYEEYAKCIKERDIPYHRIRQDSSLNNLKLKWKPLIIVFEDGAKLSIKDVE